MRPTLPLLLTALTLAGCGAGGLQAGGDRSGVPDTPIQVGRSEAMGIGYQRNDGTIVLNRETGNYSNYRESGYNTVTGGGMSNRAVSR